MNPQESPNIVIRPAVTQDAERIAWVQTRTWQSAYADIFPADRLAQLDEGMEALAERWASHLREPVYLPAFFAAENEDGEVVGFAAGGKHEIEDYPYESELQLIYILPDYQRLGIGRKLMTACMQTFVNLHFNNMLLWVLKDNQPSRQFYETLGGHLIGETDYMRWEFTYRLVGYGWDDLAAWLAAQSRHRSFLL